MCGTELSRARRKTALATIYSHYLHHERNLAFGRSVRAEILLALVMPTMQHSSNEPDAVADGPERYKASTLFTMVGNWNVEIHAPVT